MTLLLAILDSWWRSPDFVGVLLWCVPSPWSLSIFFWYFFILIMCMVQHLQCFAFAGFSSVFPFGPLEVQLHMLRLWFLVGPRRACLTRPWCYLVPITSTSSSLGFLLKFPLCLIWECLTWIFLTEHLTRSSLFFGSGKEVFPSFLLIFSSLRERCYLLFFILFVFIIRARGNPYPINYFTKFYVL